MTRANHRATREGTEIAVRRCVRKEGGRRRKGKAEVGRGHRGKNHARKGKEERTSERNESSPAVMRSGDLRWPL